ncbi:hypothetical protein SAMN07250955_105261 [Arboricoccus pini]|uniref:Uncharacterized protein n=1 Tax=Arboricoccus pini TaxID=1963835 RepID=A0A212R576_9PROT|nr:hypothetical protein SAMN07250955_105261 [Arboricoccus pini]
MSSAISSLSARQAETVSGRWPMPCQLKLWLLSAHPQRKKDDDRPAYALSVQMLYEEWRSLVAMHPSRRSVVRPTHPHDADFRIKMTVAPFMPPLVQPAPRTILRGRRRVQAESKKEGGDEGNGSGLIAPVTVAVPGSIKSCSTRCAVTRKDPHAHPSRQGYESISLSIELTSSHQPMPKRRAIKSRNIIIIYTITPLKILLISPRYLT